MESMDMSPEEVSENSPPSTFGEDSSENIV